MKRTTVALTFAGLLMATAALAPQAASAAVCRAPVSATGHGQAIEVHRFDFGTRYARLKARIKWIYDVTKADGVRFANLYHAQNVKYTEDRGAGQIYITLTATPCR